MIVRDNFNKKTKLVNNPYNHKWGIGEINYKRDNQSQKAIRKTVATI